MVKEEHLPVVVDGDPTKTEVLRLSLQTALKTCLEPLPIDCLPVAFNPDEESFEPSSERGQQTVIIHPQEVAADRFPQRLPEIPWPSKPTFLSTEQERKNLRSGYFEPPLTGLGLQMSLVLQNRMGLQVLTERQRKTWVRLNGLYNIASRNRNPYEEEMLEVTSSTPLSSVISALVGLEGRAVVIGGLHPSGELVLRQEMREGEPVAYLFVDIAPMVILEQKLPISPPIILPTILNERWLDYLLRLGEIVRQFKECVGYAYDPVISDLWGTGFRRPWLRRVNDVAEVRSNQQELLEGFWRLISTAHEALPDGLVSPIVREQIRCCHQIWFTRALAAACAGDSNRIAGKSGPIA